MGTDLYVGIAIVDNAIQMYQNNKATPWVTGSAVLFDPEHEFAGFPEELFKIKLQTITKFYSKDIVVVDGNFTVKGITYTFESLKNDSQAVYTVGTDLYVGIAIVNDTIKMYQENKTTPWIEESKVLFAPEHEFVGYMEWQFIGGGVTSIGGQDFELEMNSVGVPYLSYSEHGGIVGGDKVIVKKYDGATWVDVGVSVGAGIYPSLMIDKDDVPYVVYMAYHENNIVNKKVTVKKYDGATWVDVGVSVGVGSYPRLVMDKNDVPYVAYNDKTKGDKATVKKYNGATWVDVGEVVSTKRTDYLSLAINKDDVPYLAYREGYVNNKKTIVKKYDGATWVDVGVSVGVGSYPSLAIDKNNVPYLAYNDEVKGNKATVKKYDGATWVDTGVVSTGGGTLSLAIDSTGVPYLAYQDETDKATVKKYNGSTWVAVGVSVGAGSYPSLAMDKNNVPYLAYREGYVNNKKTIVMKYDVVK